MKIIKIVLSLIIGIVAGLLIGEVISMILLGTTPGNFFVNLRDIDLARILVVVGTSIASFLLSVFVLIVIHEGGHLLCGLLSGYRFVSFRILNLTIIREAGRLRIKRFAVAGTAGQCLLSPPDCPIKEIPTWWYNMGGLLANSIALFAVLPFLFMGLEPLWLIAAVIFCLTDLMLIIINGIPIVINGFGNDAYNARLMRDNLLSKYGLVMQLRTNALIQEGIRPRDMPSEWFDIPNSIDYKNALEVSLPLIKASWLIDREQWEDAYRQLCDIYSHKEDLIALYLTETKCELIFSALCTGRKDEARQLLDKELMDYIEKYRKVMSSKDRILCAVELFVNNDYNAAYQIYTNLEQRKDSYLLRGEVASDLAIMKKLLDSFSHHKSSVSKVSSISHGLNTQM